MLKNLALLGLRAVVGGYVAAHGAQKLFGALEGPGVEGTAGYFDSLGLQPAKQMAMLGGGAELVGGVLTATGILNPLGPLAIAGVMSTATSTHVPSGPLAQNGGFELPLTNLAAALAIAAVGPGKLRLGPHLSPVKAILVLAGTAGLSGYAISRVLAKQQEASSAPEAVAGSDAAAIAIVEAEMVAAELEREAEIDAELAAEANAEAALEAELEAEIEALANDEGLES